MEGEGGRKSEEMAIVATVGKGNRGAWAQLERAEGTRSSQEVLTFPTDQ